MGLFGRKKPVVEEIVEEVPTLPPAPPLDAAGMRSAADHTTYLLGLVEPLPPFGMSLLEAWDQVVCEDIDSMINVPPSSTAKIEGYAVRAAELVADGKLIDSLEVVDDAERLPVGTAIRVVVGQVLPKGATAVLPTSFATVADGRITLIDRVNDGDYVRAAGEHLAVGARLLSRGEILDDRSIGILAGAGIDKVLVRPRPRVVVISSGEDLVEPGDRLNHGEKADSNSFMIAAAAKAAGATVFRVALHSSDPVSLKQSITDQLIRADLLISTTGGRREDYETMLKVLGEVGLVDTVDVAMSPGRKQTFGLIGEERVPMVMLPGNPISAYVSFQVFVWPLIQRLMGASPERRAVRALATSAMRSVRGQLHLLRGEVIADGSIRSVERISDPYALAELARSNALIVLDEQTELVRAGEQAICWPLDEGRMVSSSSPYTARRRANYTDVV